MRRGLHEAAPHPSFRKAQLQIFKVELQAVSGATIKPLRLIRQALETKQSCDPNDIFDF
jgi:hypothetical protein